MNQVVKILLAVVLEVVGETLAGKALGDNGKK